MIDMTLAKTDSSTDVPAATGRTAFDATQRANWGLRLMAWSRRVGLVRKAAYAVVLLAIAAGVGTYATFTNAGPAGPDPEIVLGLLYLDLTLLVLLVLLVGQRLVGLWAQRRQGLAGSRLHVRLVMLFSGVTITPAIVVAVFSVLFFDFGIRSWFTERIGTAVESSRAVAQSYLEEHRRNILGDALAMANDLNRDAAMLWTRPKRLRQTLGAQAAVRNLSEAIVFDGSGQVMARTGLSLTFEFEPLPEEAFLRAQRGEVVTITGDVDRIRTLVRLEGFVDAYLYVGRFVDAGILEYIEETERAATEYRELEGRRFEIQITFGLIFGVVSLLLLFAAISVGLNLATRMAAPISELINAAQRVSEGDLDARVRESEVTGFNTLSHVFNRMTQQLAAQRDDLLEAHRTEDRRRRFTEAVLGGVSAGVIGLDGDGRINLPNRSAAQLLGLPLDALAERRLVDVLPETGDLLAFCRRQPQRRAEAEIEVWRDGLRITLLSRITAEVTDGNVSGFVFTFDDITELQSAQLKAAWADVARRIAHEIKNPLTPIQLSAERLKRKYLGHVTDDRETFSALIDTIVRQVEDIGRMVDEFSAFARMPSAVLDDADLAVVLREQTALHEAAYPALNYELVLPSAKIWLQFDARQIRQAVTNLLQNAADSVEARLAEDPGEPGWIWIEVTLDPAHVIVTISDNGRGLPDVYRHRLTEPYVTTREHGTGLGLAIVSKIMEDHKGRLRLVDRVGGGAMVMMEFRLFLDRTIDGVVPGDIG